MGVKKIEIPDYKAYQIGPWAPELQDVERKLAAKGLKDPWLRNEVWRFDRRDFDSPKKRLTRMFSRGFVPGVALAIISTVISNYYDSQMPHHKPWFASRTGDDGHGGHH
jgi:NADH dehydrogenase (ubiquinone) 1 beta subcomplex subunit 3